MINWKVRFRNKTFWVAIVPAILLLVQAVASVFNVRLDFDVLNGKLLEVINATFTIFVILGVINDPTVKGFSDSTQAMGYKKPKEKK